MTSSQARLAVVTSHPIQYFSPWFRWLNEHLPGQLKVFYLDDPAQRNSQDPEFGVEVSWDVPLLDGFNSVFIPNRAKNPGTHHFMGLHNPTLWTEISRFEPNATLLMLYRYRSILPRMLTGRLPPNTWLRGDSHLLNRQPGVSRWLADGVIRRAFAGLTGGLFVGQHNRRYFEHYGLQNHQLLPSPPAIDGAHYQLTDGLAAQAQDWRAHHGIRADDKVVTFVGKLINRKRPLLLLEAFQQANPANACLVFVGSGKLGPAIEAAAASDSRIHVLAFQNQQAMPTVYAASDLLVLPSVTETWGLVINEAQRLGVPALVSDRVGCGPDLVADPNCGLVFKNDSREALTAALKAALDDPQLLKVWSRNAVAVAEQRSSFAAMSQSLPRLLEAV